MRVHLLDGGIVFNTVILDEITDPVNMIDADLYGGGIGWTFTGTEVVPPPEPERTPEEIKAAIISETQARLDIFAMTRGYDDIKSAVTYAGCPVPKFDVEARYCRDIRALTWAALYTVMAEVESGQRPMPTGYSDIASALPTLEWPE